MTASLPRLEDQRTGRALAPPSVLVVVPRHEVLSRHPQNLRDRLARLRPVPHQRLGPAPPPLWFVVHKNTPKPNNRYRGVQWVIAQPALTAQVAAGAAFGIAAQILLAVGHHRRLSCRLSA
jgi:hypothetical protein